MRIFERSKSEPKPAPTRDPAVAERFAHLAYGGRTAELERDALPIEKRAMRRQWRWMATHPSELFARRKLDLIEEMHRVAGELRAVEVLPPPASTGRVERVRFGFRVTVPELTPEEIERQRAKLLALYRDVASFPDRVQASVGAHRRTIDEIEIRPISSALREAIERSRRCRTPEEIEAEIERRSRGDSPVEPDPPR